ncbi:MAG: MBL fold metallo-hydrolase [Eubacteriales bacterium]
MSKNSRTINGFSVAEVFEDVYRLTIPLPFALSEVNCYLVRGKNGWSAVDAGLNYPPGRAAWEDAFRSLELVPEAITGIYITHFHPDHYGAAGWLQELSGAPAYISGVDGRIADTFWRFSRDELIAVTGYFAKNGMDVNLTDESVDDMLATFEMVRPHARLTLLEEGETVPVGDMDCRVILTPGHSDGHICLFDERTGIFFSGDHLLPEITSNISLYPGFHPNPLKNFLASLEKIRPSGARLVLPAHGPDFTGLAARVDEILSHHRERLQRFAAAAGDGRTAFEISRAVFGKNLSLTDKRFALGETLSHLAYLVEDGQLERATAGSATVYRRKK